MAPVLLSASINTGVQTAAYRSRSLSRYPRPQYQRTVPPRFRIAAQACFTTDQSQSAPTPQTCTSRTAARLICCSVSPIRRALVVTISADGNRFNARAAAQAPSSP